ncbi:hypothetical protein RAA17_05960 [Komagataeibacter rhaeticus]|nr:hypothetical protein [Komagataeibacter rhaeticus]
MAVRHFESSECAQVAPREDRAELRSKQYWRRDEWDDTLRQMDETCLMLRELIRKYPDNVNLLEKLLKAQDQLYHATKSAEEQRQNASMARDELVFEDQRRQDIWNASDFGWGEYAR